MSFSETQFFRALADETRLRILVLLSRSKELCVCELVELLQVSQPKVSRHLAYLKDAGLVADRREGTWIHYRLSPDAPTWSNTVLTITASALVSRQPYGEDARFLKGITPRSACHTN